MKKWFITTLVLVFAWACSLQVLAAGSDEMVVALGADLSADQKAKVLEMMELTEADLQNIRVITITNEDEHKYLDAYIDPSIIGTRSLTSVKMTPKAKGEGLLVTTKNVNYCTTGMYRNALVTAGVEDKDVLVVAPSQLSGTAGLIGAIKAYEEVEDTEVSEAVLDAALDEMITTGDLENASENVNDEDIEALMAWLKAKLAAGELDTSDEDSIKETISEGETKFGVTLSPEEKERIVKVLKKLNKLGLDGGYLIGEAEKLLSKYGSDIVNRSEEAIKDAVKDANQAINDAAKEAASNAVKGFFSDLGNSVKGFFSKLFHK